MQPPRELREWIVSRRMNRTGFGDDDPATAEPVEPETPPPPEKPRRESLF